MRDLIIAIAGVTFAGFIASTYDGNRGRAIFAVITSAMLELWQSQATPSLDWSYRFSWPEFLIQTLAVVIIAQIFGRLLMPRLRPSPRSAKTGSH